MGVLSLWVGEGFVGWSYMGISQNKGTTFKPQNGIESPDRDPHPDFRKHTILGL